MSAGAERIQDPMSSVRIRLIEAQDGRWTDYFVFNVCKAPYALDFGGQIAHGIRRVSRMYVGEVLQEGAFM